MWSRSTPNFAECAPLTIEKLSATSCRLSVDGNAPFPKLTPVAWGPYTATVEPPCWTVTCGPEPWSLRGRTSRPNCSRNSFKRLLERAEVSWPISVPLQTSTNVWLESALTVDDVRLGPLPLLLIPVSVVLDAWVKSNRPKKL